jgi:glycosyltransferase involved in cell wall biosynthesis
VRNVTSAKIIAVDHNPRPLGGYTWRKKIRKRINGVRFGKYIDTYVGVSEYTRRELIKDFGNGIASRIQVVYNGIDVSRIRKRVVRNMRHPQFLVACHLRESKGIQDLIEAVSILPDLTKAHIHIDVYGDGPYRSILEEKTAAYGLQKQINFKGSSDKLFDIYANYDYLIHPTHMECFSLGLLESLAANVPVITTPVGGNEEAVKHGVNGFIFAAKNIQALSSLLMNVFEGKLSINEEVGEQIRNKFTIDMMVNNHLHLLD